MNNCNDIILATVGGYMVGLVVGYFLLKTVNITINRKIVIKHKDDKKTTD
jgi:hypothetical protein